MPIQLVEDEEWRDVAGYEGRYRVSNLGRVRGTGGLLAPNLQTSGYHIVHLYCGGRHTRRVALVHRLVALAFLPFDPLRPYVNHLDGNKQHNAARNLEWCSNSENVLHARASLPFNQYRFAVVGVHLLSGEEITFASQKAAEVALSGSGKQSSAVHHCLVGKKQSAYGYAWRRA